MKTYSWKTTWVDYCHLLIICLYRNDIIKRLTIDRHHVVWFYPVSCQGNIAGHYVRAGTQTVAIVTVKIKYTI